MCILQIACHDFVCIIDLLKITDYSLLDSLFTNTKITFLAHNASFEKRFLKTLGIEAHDIVDTLVESKKIRGLKNEQGEKISHALHNVAKRELNVDMDKTLQKSDWENRPLTKEQLQYAALDAEILLSLHDTFAMLSNK